MHPALFTRLMAYSVKDMSSSVHEDKNRSRGCRANEEAGMLTCNGVTVMSKCSLVRTLSNKENVQHRDLECRSERL